MAKLKTPKHDTGKIITTPSSYGSHKSMVVDTPENLTLSEGYVVCQDDLGMYITEENKLDNGLADPNRYGDRTKRV